MSAARVMLALLGALALAAIAAAPAQAAFGLKGLGVEFEKKGGAPETGAGTHPFALITTVDTGHHHHRPRLRRCPRRGAARPGDQLPGRHGRQPDRGAAVSRRDFANIVGGRPSCSAAPAIGVAKLTLGLG